MAATWDAMVAAGLLVPDAPPDDDRRQLLALLVERGATVEQMCEAERCGNLAALAGDLLLEQPAALDEAAVAGRLGITTERVRDAMRASGLPVPDPCVAAYTERDVEMLAALEPALELFPGDVGLQLLRVISSSIARIADASVAAYIDNVERGIATSGGSQLEHAHAIDEAMGVLGGTIDALGPLLVRHMQQAIVRSRLSRQDVSGYEVARLAIGFVDLVGFTPLSQRVPVGELAGLVTAFEATASDLITEWGGRLVKLIGDEVMFVAVSPDHACAIAEGLLTRFLDDERGIVPRGAITYGEVLVSGGDYYGPVVNLAARLAGAAVPLEVLVTAEVCDAVEGDAHHGPLVPAGRRMLKGFADPVPVWSLGPAPS